MRGGGLGGGYLPGGLGKGGGFFFGRGGGDRRQRFEWMCGCTLLGADTEQADEVVVGPPDAMTAVRRMWESADLADWRRWVRWRVIRRGGLFAADRRPRRRELRV